MAVGAWAASSTARKSFAQPSRPTGHGQLPPCAAGSGPSSAKGFGSAAAANRVAVASTASSGTRRRIGGCG